MEKSTFISFPGLGIEPFRVDSVAFTLFGRNVMWYGIFVALGILFAFLCVLLRAKKSEKIKAEDVLDYAVCLVVSGVIGARLFYVAGNLDSYRAGNFFDTLGRIFAVWEGGLAIFGGIAAGALALLLVSKVKKIPPGKAFDAVAPGLLLGQILGRLGNFFNAEGYGIATSLPWRMGIREASQTVAVFVHPTFLYEILFNLLGFLLLNLYYKRKKYDGQIALLYLTWYGFGRMLIEELRTDALTVGSLRISQLAAFLCFFFGLAALISMQIVLALRAREAAHGEKAPAPAGKRKAPFPAVPSQASEERFGKASGGSREEAAEPVALEKAAENKKNPAAPESRAEGEKGPEASPGASREDVPADGISTDGASAESASADGASSSEASTESTSGDGTSTGGNSDGNTPAGDVPAGGAPTGGAPAGGAPTGGASASDLPEFEIAASYAGDEEDDEEDDSSLLS